MSAQSNDSLEEYIELWETSKKLFPKELLKKEFSEFNFDDVRLNLVVDPKRPDLKKPQIKIPNDMKLICGSEYSEIAVPNAQEHTDDSGWSNFSDKGYCAYADNVVYIGFPYKNSDIPLERAFIHELGHYIQQKKGYVIGCNSNENILLEYHNIMFHENIINTPKGNKFLYDDGGMRFTYNKISYKSTIVQIRQDVFSVSELITKLKGLVSTRQTLIEEMGSKKDVNKTYNHLLLYNCYKELKAC